MRRQALGVRKSNFDPVHEEVTSCIWEHAHEIRVRVFRFRGTVNALLPSRGGFARLRGPDLLAVYRAGSSHKSRQSIAYSALSRQPRTSG